MKTPTNKTEIKPNNNNVFKNQKVLLVWEGKVSLEPFCMDDTHESRDMLALIADRYSYQPIVIDWDMDNPIDSFGIDHRPDMYEGAFIAGS